MTQAENEERCERTLQRLHMAVSAMPSIADLHFLCQELRKSSASSYLVDRPTGVLVAHFRCSLMLALAADAFTESAAALLAKRAAPLGAPEVAPVCSVCGQPWSWADERRGTDGACGRCGASAVCIAAKTEGGR